MTKRQKIVVSLGAAVLSGGTILGWGIWQWVLFAVARSGAVSDVSSVAHQDQLSDQRVSSDYEEDTSLVSESVEKLAVDVSGAVARPGVYFLRSGDRIVDAIQVSGGFSPQADRLAIAQDLNQAQPLTKDQKLYIPLLNDGQKQKVSPASSQPASAQSDSSAVLISLNSATQSQLESLPGVGSTRAASIIKLRPYTSFEDMVQRVKLPSTVAAELKELVAL